MKIRKSIPFVLLLATAFLLSGCTQGVKDSFNKGREDAKQQFEKKDEQTQGQSTTQNSEQAQKDITLLTSLKAGLDEQYNLSKAQKATTMDSGWLNDFNSTLSDISSRYKDISLEKDKTGFYISTAIGDLRTLSQEYENSLHGKDSDLNFFSSAFEEDINKARENLPQ